MTWTKRVVSLVLITGMPAAGAIQAGELKPIPAERFAKLHKMIKPQPGESRWLQIPWLTSVWEARQQAAREGKPIYIWAGSGGGPVGVC